MSFFLYHLVLFVYPIDFRNTQLSWPCQPCQGPKSRGILSIVPSIPQVMSALLLAQVKNSLLLKKNPFFYGKTCSLRLLTTQGVCLFALYIVVQSLRSCEHLAQNLLEGENHQRKWLKEPSTPSPQEKNMQIRRKKLLAMGGCLIQKLIGEMVARIEKRKEL